MLILQALSLGPLHGYGVIQRIRQLSDKLLEVEQGALSPAVYRTLAARPDQFQMGGARDRPQGQVLHADYKQLTAEEESGDRLALAIAKVRKAV